MRITFHTNLDPAGASALENELSGPQNLLDLMQWAAAYPPGTFTATVISNVVVQDEFTHDVIVPFRDGLVLVYDTT